MHYMGDIDLVLNLMLAAACIVVVATLVGIWFLVKWLARSFDGEKK